MFTEQSFIDLISVLPVVEAMEVRVATVILKDGVEAAPRKYHRYVVTRGEDLSGHDPLIRSIAAAIWTA